MTVAIDLVLILHFIGLAAIIGSWMTVLKEPRVIPGMLHGAILQVVTGLALAVLGLRKAAVAAPTGGVSAIATVTSTAPPWRMRSGCSAFSTWRLRSSGRPVSLLAYRDGGRFA